MINLRRAGATLLVGGGIALSGAASFADGTAALDDAGPGTSLPCRMSSTRVPAIEWAAIQVSPQDPNICVRRRMGGVEPAGLSSCHEVAKQLGCTVVIDGN